MGPLCWSTQVAARWASAQVFATWATATKSIATESLKATGGMTVLIELRALPALCLFFTGALAAAAQGQWDNLRVLAVDSTVPTSAERKVALVDAPNPYVPFGHDDLAAHVLARSIVCHENARDRFPSLRRSHGGQVPHTSG